MWLFWIGLGGGVLLTVPVAAILARKWARRLHRLEARARAAERLAELGTLTGGLAHEIKNPLSTIGLNIQLLQEDLGQLAQQATPDSGIVERVGPIRRRLDSLARETQRLRDILEDFLRFAGRVKLDLTPTDIHALIDELVDFYAPQAEAARVQLRTQLSAQPPVVPADPSLFKQALLNLIINATQAMTEARHKSDPHGGCNELIIRTERRKAAGQDELQVHVIDTGPGIAPDRVEKVFQPYFSTKKGGTGLGLPTARRIVEEHGGTIHVLSEIGKGTDFVVSLPSDGRDTGKHSRAEV